MTTPSIPSPEHAKAIVAVYANDGEYEDTPEMRAAEVWYHTVFDMATSAPLTITRAAAITKELAGAGLNNEEITHALASYAEGGTDDDLARSIDGTERWSRPE